MAVQQNKKSPSKRNMRRAHDAISSHTFSEDPTTGGLHRRHHVGKDGFYRGKQVIEVKGLEEKE